MFKCPEGIKTGDFIKEFAKNAIMIRPAFYLPDHIRLTIGKPDENRKFLDVLEKFQAT
jgi:histidinol-phosphate aminotransferase